VIHRRLLLAALPCLVLCAGEVREEILVEVNGHIISRRVYQQAVEQGTAALYREFSGAELDPKLRTAREKTLQGLVDTFVVMDKAADLGITVSDEQLRGFVDQIKKDNNLPTDADLERALQTSLGVGLKAYMARAREDLVKQEVLRREVYSRIAVETQEIQAYYQEHRAEFRMPSRFRMRELVLPKGDTPEAQQDTQTKLATIREELAKGTPFEKLVEQYSSSPSRSTGGDLGWLDPGMLRPDLESAVLALRKDQVSAPVSAGSDIYLVQLTEAELDKYKPFADVQGEIRAKLQEPKAQTAIEAYIQGLRIRANIRYIVPRDTILKG
jgi:parvulin-like peptidyl-prolyl isomerase